MRSLFCIGNCETRGQNGDFSLEQDHLLWVVHPYRLLMNGPYLIMSPEFPSEETPSIAFSYQNRFAIAGLSNVGAGIVTPLSFGVAGISAFRFGDDLFSEQRVGLSFASNVGFVSLGSSVNYIQYRIADLRSRQLFSVDFGGLVSISDNIRFGAFITNVNQANISSFENERLPTIIRIGLSYLPIEQLMLNLELQKDLDFEEQLKFG